MVASVKHISGLMLISCLLSGSLLAQEYRITAKLNKSRVMEGRRVQLTYSIEGGRIEDFIPPQFPPSFRSGTPRMGEHTQIMNGRVSKSLQYSFNIVPDKSGTYTIPPAKVTVAGGAIITSEAVKIIVFEKGEKEKMYQAELANSIFLRATATKLNPYEGEQIRLVYKLYFKKNLRELSIKSKPNLGSFWVETISDESQLKQSSETLNGQAFQTAVIWDKIVFPQESGKIVLDPMIMEMQVGKLVRGRDMWGWPSQQMQYSNFRANSGQLVLDVKDLPEPKPAGFSGIVGSVDFSVEVSDTQAEVGEAITYRVKLSGKGNVKLFSFDKPQIPTDIEVHDPITQDKYSTNSGRFGGSRSYEFLLIPGANGVYKMPKVNFAYFDTELGDYKKFVYNNMYVKVGDGGPAMASSDVGIPGTPNQNDVTVFGEDIRFIHEGQTDLAIKGALFFGSAKHIALTASPFALLFMVFFFKRRKTHQTADLISYHKKKAASEARNRLKMATKHLANGDSDAVYTELMAALSKYVIQKFTISPAELSKARAMAEMEKLQIGQDIQAKFADVWQQLEMAKYAPSQIATPSNLLQDVQKIIVELESA